MGTATAVVGSAVEAVEAVVGSGSSKKDGEAKKEKKEQKEKAAKPAPAVKEESSGPMPSMIDMRVGKVLEGAFLAQSYGKADVPVDDSKETPGCGKSLCRADRYR